jgi:hypothetical protein
MIAAAVDFDTDTGPACRVCGGPVLYYAGSVHGWTCRGCLEDYLDAGAARAEANDRKDRQRLARKTFHDSNQTPTFVGSAGDRRRDGGGPQICSAPRPASIHLRTYPGRAST